jgi:DNA polymerase delta subunit 2
VVPGVLAVHCCDYAQVGAGHAVAKILCLEDGCEQVTIGTLYKDMKLRPTILKEYTLNKSMASQLGATHFLDPDDNLILEDESARIRMTGSLHVERFVTGMVLAVRGVFDADKGVLVVSDFIHVGVL